MAVPQASWTILATLRWTADYFRTKGVTQARACRRNSPGPHLGVSRLDLYLRYDRPLNPGELAHFKGLVVRRREGEPVAYLTGHREFWSLDFRVTPAVLIPRPETETLVAAALEAAKDFRGEGEGPTAPPPPPNPLPQPHMAGDGGAALQPAPGLEYHPKTQNLKPETSPLWGAEIGVGSGAVVIALAKELPQMAWVGLDRSAAALAVWPGRCPASPVLHGSIFSRLTC